MSPKHISEQNMKHIESLNKCYTACKETYINMKQNQMVSIKKIFVKHSSNIQKIGTAKIIVAYMNNDLLSVIKAVNELLKKPETKPLIVEILKDIREVYKDNKENINAITQCYLNKCDNEAIEITKQITELSINIISMMEDKAVQKEIKLLKTQLLKNIIEFQKSLNKT
jgi:hypothetical protein